jgi:ribosomal protein S25
VVQQDCPRLAHKTAIGLGIAIKCLQKLDEARRIICKLLAGQRQEKW